MAQKTSKSLSPRGRFWQRHIQQWQKSGATQSRYCREHDLSIAAFHWWRRKLARGGSGRESPKELPVAPVPIFTEIRIPEGDPAPAMYPYEILLPNRIHVRLRQNFDTEAVSRLVSVLGAPC